MEMMKFKFKISKLANQFFFISNLSEWHFSCRKNYNKEWLKQTGPLNKKEKKALDDFRKIIKNYGFTHDKNRRSVYLGQIFFICPENQIWEKLERFVEENEFKKIQQIFKVFQPRFEKIWNNKSLNERVGKVKKSLTKQNIKSLFKNLYQLLPNKSLPRDFMVVSIISPLKGKYITAAGGANLDNHHITLEIPWLKLNTWELEHSTGVLAHEIAHILFRLSNLRNIIQMTIKKFRAPMFIKPLKRSMIELIEELVISSMIPSGYLAQKYYKFKPVNMFSESFKDIYQEVLKLRQRRLANTHRVFRYFIWQLYPLAAYYLKSNKKIDKFFIEEVARLILKEIKE